MDARTFLGLEPVSGDRLRWRMEVVRGLTSGTGALFGGCGLGACIEVMEEVTGRPCIWATAQYLSFARPPAILELDVTEVVRGHQISQARVLARVGDTEILTVLGALGTRPLPLEGQWAVMPDVPGPLECPPRPMMNRHEGTIASRLDAKLADGRAPWDFPGPEGSGNSALWIRLPELLDMSATALAIIGDFVPFGIGQALGQRAGGNSLDNTLRVAHRVPTEWVLADVRVHSVADGFGHGLVHLWAENGTLLGTASQSSIVRAWRGDQNEPLTELEGDGKPRP
ncbi:MAG TPA: acyl-CoA thioesterase [Acidimicrobiia bacterium]|nr:acyl-CoA thioesterase [Acidimicrobiia bacterium]